MMFLVLRRVSVLSGPKAWEGSVLFSALRKLLDAGLCDGFRLFEQPEKSFSWWGYRMQAFRRNHGL